MAQGFLLNSRRVDNAFRITIDTSKQAKQQIGLQMDETHLTSDFTINWGDGTIERYYHPLSYGGYMWHNYDVVGVYQISVIGDFKFSSFVSLGYVLTSINNWGAIKFSEQTHETHFHGFSGFENLEKIPNTPLPPSANGLISLDSWFSTTKKLKSIPDNFLKNCVNVTTIYNMFQQSGIETIGKNFAKGLTSLTTAQQAIQNCYNLQTIGESMFEGCINLKTVLWMAENNRSLTAIGDNHLTGCVNLEVAQSMYYNCENLSYVPNHMFYDCKKVENYLNVFYNSGTIELPPVMFDFDHLPTRGAPFSSTFGSNNGKSKTGTAYPLWEYYPYGGYGSNCYQNQTNLTNYADIPDDWK